MSTTDAQARLVVCVRNDGSEDLELRKLYPVIPDSTAEADGYLRVVDESGEDYLYPAAYFAEVELANDVSRLIRALLIPSAA